MQPSLCVNLSADEQDSLLEIARQSIHFGLQTGRALQLDLKGFNDNLQIVAAVFITLTRFGDLRGCIGSLQAADPLAQAVANSAFNAAFKDRRFGKVANKEMNDLRIEISVLSELEPVEAVSQQMLLDKLQPGVDGLLMEDQSYRSTFLPKVWEKLPSANQFLGELMQKAGLPPGHWSDSIRFHRYHTLSFAEN
ncbi:MAG: AmmeMemoRadiSam system protein A [Gammaproteobacteria bacterium]|nr:AmmeMemoRadiSam system protein A [Gammaproteobacteria bacterium]